MKNLPILIVGGNGKTGRRVAQLLTAQDLDVRMASRSTTPGFDWTDRSTWTDALRGVSAAYVTYQPDLAVPHAASDIAEFGRIAKQEGVRKIVLLSGRGEEGAEKSEDELKKTGIDWTIIRASWFNQNFSESFLLDGVLSGEITLPVESVREPFIDVDDIADVAVAALTEARHSNKLYEVTGPRAINFAEVAEEIAAVVEHPVRFTSISPEAFVDGLKGDGVPHDVVELLRELFTMFDGRNTQVMNGVEEALGRPPREFSEYARNVAATGAWGLPQ